MNKKLFSALIFLSLLLTGCKGETSLPSVNDELSSELTTKVSEVPTSTSEKEEEQNEKYEELLLSLGFESYNAWPEAEINNYLAEHEIAETVPTLPNVAKCFMQLTLDDPYFEHYLSIYIPKANRVEEYLSLLEAEGFRVYADEEDETYFMADSPEETIYVDLFFDVAGEDLPEGTFIFIEAVSEGNGETDLPDLIPVTFDFSSEDQITNRDALQSVWQFDDDTEITMTIDKAESTVGVGNLSGVDSFGYFTDPLRIYNGQVVTFSVPEDNEIHAVLFETAGAWPKGDSVEAVANSADENVEVENEDDDVIFFLNEPANSYVFTLTAQARFNAITIFII